ncbi:TetR/AcrR family transcriptional regulator [Kitasatospora sp. GP82]|uniref:TetR/AcrR family transcriptional regulator n=1 Tax=Kitasatospora sp. GP82 TaxID=3035089 RepID=UPI002474D73B|nr:TetR/AcrR family transcriptional regulator [Kitasatospora sp. GP82]MDH6124731.1 AcrR family transcriptional regulator [Kitasatospora sp. GP82]
MVSRLPRPGVPVESAALVFGREGYTRASVDAIAAEAGVSKRTIYNHYADKEQLFLSVALEGATAFSETITEIADRHLRKIVDLEEDLIAFGIDRAKAVVSAKEHFALARTIRAEASHIPPDVLDAWAEAGPRKSQRDIAEHLARIADRGLLVIDDADEATNHFTLLTFTNVADQSFFGAIPIAESASGSSPAACGRSCACTRPASGETGAAVGPGMLDLHASTSSTTASPGRSGELPQPRHSRCPSADRTPLAPVGKRQRNPAEVAKPSTRLEARLAASLQLRDDSDWREARSPESAALA